jgi:hypothetical protein
MNPAPPAKPAVAPPPPAKSGGELFIVNNSDEAGKGLRYLQDWTDLASAFDIATGDFEIGALLALDGRWQKLDNIRTFPALVRYLESELEWPVESGSFEDLTFEYVPAELGLKDEDAVKIKKIHQLRPLESGQPWGVFFVEFEKKRLPVVVRRRILSHLVIKKCAAASQAERAALKCWMKLN